MNGFWSHAKYYPECPAPDLRLTGPETPTPLESLDAAPFAPCHLKREDFLPCGSHKERAACFQVSLAKAEGFPGVVIPSSGNAAIAVAHYARQAGITAACFLSPETPGGKIRGVIEEGGRAILSPKPINHARYAARIFGLPNLRPSQDPRAVTGFLSLGLEIGGQFPEDPPEAVFMFSTSGASLLGIAGAFRILVEEERRWRRHPSIHAVQAGGELRLAERFDPRPVVCEPGAPAGRGGVSGEENIERLSQWIRETDGGAWAIRESEIRAAEKVLSVRGTGTSPEGMAALAAVARWREGGGSGRVLVILSGRPFPAEPVPEEKVLRVDSYTDVRSAMRRLPGLA